MCQVSCWFLYQVQYFVLLEVQIRIFKKKKAQFKAEMLWAGQNRVVTPQATCGRQNATRGQAAWPDSQPKGASVNSTAVFGAALPATLTSKRLAGSRLYCWLLSSSCSPSRLQSVPSNGSEISVLRKHKGKYCHEGNLHRYLQKAGLSHLPKGCLC